MALNQAVCVLAAKGKRIKDLYRPIHDIVKSLAEAGPMPPVLRRLAAIRHFDLFVSATPDDMLARAIDAERFQGSRQTDQIEYAPRLSTDRRRDLPAVPTSLYAAVFYLFGKLDPSYPFFAIHDEDALEFPFAASRLRLSSEQTTLSSAGSTGSVAKVSSSILSSAPAT